MKNCPSTNSVLLKVQPGNKWLLFENPLEVFEVYRPSKLHNALYMIDDRVDSEGLYAAGFLSYEAGAAFDDALKVKSGNDFPLLWFGLYKSATETGIISESEEDIPKLNWIPELDYRRYLEDIRAIKKYIEKGETYQVNYTFRLRSDFKSDPWPFFNILALNHDPPYAAFVNTVNYSVCSFSPELFFRMDREILLSRPMKGTLPRKCPALDDQMQSLILKRCPKSRAENVMITDMVRNDLARVADPGSVEVTRLFDAEKYPTLWQMTSEVRCRTRARIQPVLRALFPPSSITGAPKASTMNIISSLEISPRRIYTGTIGYLGPNRQSQFNVAIRTVLVDKGAERAEYGVGGGIVWDSTPRGEWDECATKAKSLHRQNPSFSLLETMLWTPEEGYHLLPAHLDRLKSSAGYFDFMIDIREIKWRLDEFSRDLSSACWKVRLLADRKGRINIEKMALDPLPEPVSLSLAQKPVDRANPFLFHKTTFREIYNSALPENSGADSVILWNEQGQVTESTTANITLAIDGDLYTPPVRCGLLAGTYRRYLLGCGMIREKIILKEDLKACPDIFLINSVGGFIPAQMV